jgi:hypothetical protein
MDSEQQNNVRLSSWKEIAAYLDCDVRTCRRWEMSKGLPVHRVGKSEKARVYAYRHELDQWLKAQAQKNNHKKWAMPKKYSFKWHQAAWGILGTAVALATYFTITAFTYSRIPYDFRIERSRLIILNQDGRELWRYDTGLENLSADSSYRESWQYKRRIEGDKVEFPLLIIKDINQNGKPEILFSLQTQNEENEGELICFDHTGVEKWRFRSGRELVFGDKLYSHDYRIKGFETLDMEQDGDLEILLIAVHKPDFPCQLAILDHSGKVQGEYWNAGYFTDIVLHDLDQDSKEEMIVSGINNEYGKGCLLVFDPLKVNGFSPQLNPQYQCEELERGTQRSYILFPRADVRQAYPVDGIMSISIMNSGGLSLINELGGLGFEVKNDLSIHRVILTHTYQALHEEERMAGKIESVLDESYIDKLKTGLLYYNGREWVSEPTERRY